jgi:hypothetical protein
MQDKPHRRLNLTQPYSQTNGSTLTNPENGNGNGVEHSHPEEPATPAAVTSAVQPLMQNAGGRPAYLVVPLDSANEALKSAFGEDSPVAIAPPTSSTTPAPPGRNWLLPALGGMAVGAVVVGVVAFQGFTSRSEGLGPTTRPVASAPVRVYAPAKAPKRVVPAVVQANAGGVLTLTAAGATTHGEGIRQAPDAIGYWDGPNASVTWAVETPRAGRYQVALTYALEKNCGGPFVVQAGDGRISARSRSTGGWTAYRTVSLGKVMLPKGRATVSVRPNGKLATALMNLRTLLLTPTSPGQSRMTRTKRGRHRA